ncbi:g6115 [Coccomyxa viridis]|uniref:G6115 protein n=1 Tax=Coccomyxa viridis TaxID=1274662 RepID=A0ABP1FUL9_9CHLO
MQCGLVPSANVGNPVGARGIFFPGPGVTKGMAFGFELIITFVLVKLAKLQQPFVKLVKQSSITAWWDCQSSLLESGNMPFVRPTSGAFAAGPYTGGAANPARVLGSAIVFNSKWGDAWVYVLAQLAGGLLSAAFSFPLYGLGADWARLWDRSSLRPHIHRRHHSRGTGSKSLEIATPKEPTLEEALGIADPFGPDADASPSVSPETKAPPKQVTPAGAGNAMARGGGNAGKAPPALVNNHAAAKDAPTTARGEANAGRPPADTTMSDAPGFSGGQNWNTRQGLFGP